MNRARIDLRSSLLQLRMPAVAICSVFWFPPDVLAQSLASRAEPHWDCPVDQESDLLFVSPKLFTPRATGGELPSSCADFDGDGYSPDGGECGPVDCDDNDPMTNPGAPEICDGTDNDCDGAIEPRYVDKDGEEFCLDIVVDTGYVGADVPATVYGYHESGVAILRFRAPDSTEVSGFEFSCSSGQYCQFETFVPARSYPGLYVVGATLEKLPLSTGVAWTSQALYVKCPDEYCEPDPLYIEFVDWMRTKGYMESIVSYYADIRFRYAPVPYWYVPNDNFRFLLRRRPSGITQPLVLTFHDLIPTDTEATYTALGLGEGPLCEPSAKYDNWCQAPTATDYKFIEEHFERTFGIDFEFVYQRTETDYSDVRGDPTLVDSVMYRFPFPQSFNASFQHPDIVHSAMDTWLGWPLDPLTTAQHAAWCQLAPHTISRIVVFTHEWGHTAGISHAHYDDPDSGWVFWRLNGVGDNSYRTGFPPILDMTDPLERYIIEPIDGYQDEATFAATYNDYIIGSSQMPRCALVEPEILSASVLEETALQVTYRLTLANLGNANVSFVSLTAFDGSASGPMIEERIIDRLLAGESVPHDFTIDKAEVTDSVVFVVDREDRIKEMLEYPETACPNPILCGDANFDGTINISDIAFLVNHVFKSGPGPFPAWTGNVNGSAGITAGDIIYLINYIFKSGPVPACNAGSA